MNALLSLLLVAASATPWYDRADCRAVSAMIFGNDPDAARRAIAVMPAGDVAAQACARWAALALAETEHRSSPQERARREAAKALFEFASKHRERPDIRDLALEARMYRIQHLIDDGRLGPAKAEIELLARQIEREAGRADATPTARFVGAVWRGAAGSASRPVRFILELLGMRGDLESSARTLSELIGGQTAYRDVALSVAHHFAMNSDAFNLGPPCKLSAEMVRRFPESARHRATHAADLGAPRCRPK